MLQNIIEMLETSLSDVGADVLEQAAEEIVHLSDEEALEHLKETIMKNPFKRIAEVSAKTVNDYEEHRNDPKTQQQVEELMKLLQEDNQLLITDETDGEDDGNSGNGTHH